MRVDEIEVGKVYENNSDNSFYGMFRQMEVTWTDAEFAYIRRPGQFGECLRQKLTAFARWAKSVAASDTGKGN